MAVGVPVNFDGTNDYERRAAALTGMANGKIGLFGTWFRFLGTGQTSRFITFYNFVSDTICHWHYLNQYP